MGSQSALSGFHRLKYEGVFRKNEKWINHHLWPAFEQEIYIKRFPNVPEWSGLSLCTPSVGICFP